MIWERWCCVLFQKGWNTWTHIAHRTYIARRGKNGWIFWKLSALFFYSIFFIWIYLFFVYIMNTMEYLLVRTHQYTSHINTVCLFIWLFSHRAVIVFCQRNRFESLFKLRRDTWKSNINIIYIICVTLKKKTLYQIIVFQTQSKCIKLNSI